MTSLACLLQKTGVNLHCPLVGHGRIVIATSTYVNVEGHVHQMSSPRSQASQAIRAWQGASGISRRLSCVDVVMVRARVVWILLQDPFKHAYDLDRIRLGLAVRAP